LSTPDAPDECALLHHGGRAARWGNLGLWTPGTDYAGACAALAEAVGRAAHLAPGDHVLSVACGEGEELRLWVDQFEVASACGVERAPGAAGAPDGDPPRIERIQADASTWTPPRAAFDAVLCVDAAYHFAPRARWLARLRAALRPGGRLAFTDLVLDPRPAWHWRRLALRAAAASAGLALGEIVGPAIARERVAAAGFDDVVLRRLDDEVLGGFAAFVPTQEQRLGERARTPAWRRPRATARWIGPCRAAGLGYALLSARAAMSA
jgi:SAM-dependent methyltransferase